MNLEFDELSFRIKGRIFQKTEKIILNNISGEFRCNELTAIMGASGSGKTSLLNILSGFSKNKYTGLIKVNNSPRDMVVFRNFSAYVMQEDSLFPLLSVHETMTLAMKFKVGNKLNSNQQTQKINEILKMLSLEISDKYVAQLSGGERKRLSIAVELTNDPQLIFLDEPTSGLDISTSTQCINLLKNIAKNGHTVICTIHQPSALHFRLFDHLYVLADGNCIYQGKTKNLVPFLAELDLNCPETYNPADFLLEIACNEYGSHNEKLIEKIENGKNNNFRSPEKSDTSCFELLYDKCSRKQQYSLPFKDQFWLLLMRSFLFMKRDSSYFILRLVLSFIFGLAISSICYQIGNDASQMLNSYKYVFFSTNCVVYVSVFTLMLRFPLDRHIIIREHFNRHYSSLAYYFALVLVDFPLLVLCTAIYCLISYPLTGQPMELERILFFLAISIVTAFASQAFGLLCGTMFNMGMTLFVCQCLLAYTVVFSGFFIYQKDAPSYLYYNFETNVIKHAVDSTAIAIFGWNRTKVPCTEIYCHFQRPSDLLRYLGVDQNNFPYIFYSGPILFFVAHVLTYLNLRYKLSR